MLSILAIILVILLLAKCILFMISPNWMSEFMYKFYNQIDQVGIYVSCGMVCFTIFMGLILSQLMGLNALIAAGWFWGSVYTLSLLPFVLNFHKKGYLKNFELDPTNKSRLFIGCIFIVCFCLLSIGFAF